MNSQVAKNVNEIITISNKTEQNLTMAMEPWGDELAFPAGTCFRIEADGPSGGGLEIEIAAAQIVVWGWVGSRLTIFAGGTVTREYPIRVPPVP